MVSSSSRELPSSEANTLPREQLLEAVIHAASSLIENEQAALGDFIAGYYGSVPVADLNRYSIEELACAAVQHWQLCKHRAPGEFSLQVLNPAQDTHGWHSAHTVIQLVIADQSHLISSLRSQLLQMGHAVHSVIHPILAITRDEQTQLIKAGLYQHEESEQSSMESVLRIDIDRLADEKLPTLTEQLSKLLRNLQLWGAAQASLQNQLKQLRNTSESQNHRSILGWLVDHRFACFGIARVSLTGDAISDEASGMLDAESDIALWQTGDLLSDENIGVIFQSKEDYIICKAPAKAPLIRDEHADLLLLIDNKNKTPYCICIIGLFQSRSTSEAIENLGLLRARLTSALAESQTTADSYDSKALNDVMYSFPRSMLLQTQAEQLHKMARSIVALQERQQIRVFGTEDSLKRFCNCLVYIPSDTYSRELRLTIESILLSYIDGISAEFQMRFSSESALARLHFIIEKRPPHSRLIDWHAIELRVQQAAVSWEDQLLESLQGSQNSAKALSLFRQYRNAFPANYKEDYSAATAVSDIAFIDAQEHDGPSMGFYRQLLEDVGIINFKLFANHDPVSLYSVMPIIENLGLRVEAEHPFEIKREHTSSVWIHEFTVEHAGTQALAGDQVASYIEDAFSNIWHGYVEDDGFNQLILTAGLNWRQVVILRSYCRYLLQIAVPFSQQYMIDSLVANPQISFDLVKLFETRFTPDLEQRDCASIEDSIKAALNDVTSLDEDRILRAFFQVICATLRTNFYCKDEHGQPLSYISYKLDSQSIPDLPLPRPMVEIFVYAPEVEGIHLRGGKVARGGLRWSDRREDFRTEVLGLMKAQMVKNAVIVPQGSKGGFYVKLPATEDRDTNIENAVHCYKIFLRGLLDITDNIVGEKIVAPADVVRYDENDPYLVVAADKGTATFSDYANAVSADYNFWLGDAFASGGSVGYDHKKMGITARGAWESVKRHFRGLNLDTQSEAFTAVGIGDMAGDVFGNGLLLSTEVKLVAAFNHQHIFIDPNPDASTSFQERKRLFALPRSSWTDYDSTLLSQGGGIYSRSDKQIELSAEARQALACEQTAITPNDLIAIILKAPVDLLWNGGIGTYIKAKSESNAQAADRANDAVRINAEQLRCKVIGEGGNLGVTQLGRIEYAEHAGLIYTDAIDNSAGVDCSDHEVNIKILLNKLVQTTEISQAERDSLLESMTDEVGSLVLRDNYLQTQCIDLSHVDGAALLSEHARFIQHLVNEDQLDREIEHLPDNEMIADRLASGIGLHRPEIAVLVSYSKMVMYEALLDSDFDQDPALIRTLLAYFPVKLSDAYATHISSHRLRSEIIATTITNEFVNRLGPSFAFRMQEELGVNYTDLAAAFVAIVEIFDMPALWQSIESLDNKVTAEIQYQMLNLVRGLVERATHWLIRSKRGNHRIDEVIAQFKPGISNLIASLPDSLAGVNRQTLDQRIQHFVDAGVPHDTALAVARVVPLSSSLDIVEIAMLDNQDVGSVAACYFELGSDLDLHWLRECIGDLQVSSHWHTLAKSELRIDLHYQQRHLCAEVISGSDDSSSAKQRVAQWAGNNAVAVDKYHELINDMKASSAIDFAMLSLAVNEVHKLLKSDRPLAAANDRA